MLLKNKRLIFILIGSILIFIILPLVLFLIYSSNQNSEIYNDPLSGEVVYNPKDRVPEKYNQSIEEPVVLGLSSLLKRGVSSDNVETIRSYFTFYNKNKHEGNEISIDINSITHEVINNKAVYTFIIRPDRDKSKDSRVEVVILNDSVDRFIIKRSNGVIFDSRLIETYHD